MSRVAGYKSEITKGVGTDLEVFLLLSWIVQSLLVGITSNLQGKEYLGALV